MDTEEFINPVDEELLCGICQGVMVNPKCCRLGHCWCLECIDSWLLINSTCPSDGLDLQSTELSDLRPIANMISKLQAYCTQDDCSWIGELGQRESHWLKECLSTEIDCENEGCSIQIKRGELQHHMTNLCEMRLETCKYCYEKMNYKLIKNHGDNLCDVVEMLCPNKCGYNILRKDLSKHMELTCELSEISCTYSKYGCLHRCLRKHMLNHETMKKDEHIELIIKEFNKLEIKCEKQAKAYSKQSEVCASQDFRMKELMIENEQLMTTLCEQQDEIKSLKENTKTATTTDSTGSVRSSFFGLIKSPSSASSPSSSSSPLSSSSSSASSSSSSSLSSFSSSSSSSSVPINPSGSNHVVEKREKTCPGNHGLCLTKTSLLLSTNVTCDACAKKVPRSTMARSCRLCNYDLCLDCFGSDGKVVPNCPHQHGLQNYLIPNQSYTCDGCGCRLPKGTLVKDCRRCNYDLCLACSTPKDTVSDSSAEESPLKTCPNEHRLHTYLVPNHTYTCDGCGCNLPINSLVKDCRRCNYDLCDSCFHLNAPNESSESNMICSNNHKMQTSLCTATSPQPSPCTGCGDQITRGDTVVECATCKYSFCNNCQSFKHLPVCVNIKTCPGSHGLKNYLVPNSSFTCDGCKTNIPQHSLTKDCRICNYDLCDQCFQSKNCPQLHGLQAFIISNDKNIACDVCDVQIPSGSTAKGCRVCDYDICENCFK